MDVTRPASAVIVRVALPPRLARLRSRWDRAAADGVPPHLTVLFPFLPPDRLDPAVRLNLAAIGTGHAPFEATFRRVGRFPGVVYLVPEPADPFARLTADVAGRFPDHPPYGGAFGEVIPHLTITESDEADLDAIAAEASTALPFRRRIEAIEVLAQGQNGRWRGRWRLRLGVRP